MKIIDRTGGNLDFNAFEKTGRGKMSSLLNWNGIVLLDDRDNKVDLARCYMRELKKASCGFCVPCSNGTNICYDILTRICNGKGKHDDIERIKYLCGYMIDSSRCTIGTIGPKPVLDLIERFGADFEDAIVRKEEIPEGNYYAKVTAPCINGCPSKLDIPNWIEMVRYGRFEEALESVRQDTPLAGILGRSCFHPCQDNCRRANIDESIRICLIRRFAADYEFDRSKKTKFEIKNNGIKVAIIGSGPAGLSCAYYLRLKGYKPVIFEALPLLGGMLSVGIPRFRIDQEFLDKEIGYILSTKIDYHLNQRLGRDFQINDLFNDGFKSVFIAIGSHKGKNINLPGENDNLDGFYDGVDFLRRVAMDKIEKTGSKVIIEGGGNVAIDCCRTALRLGFKDVTVVYRRTKAEMPAASYEVDTAMEESVKFRFLTDPVAIISKDGAVTGVRCRKMKLGAQGKDGRKMPEPIEGSDFEMECDTFIMAIGQENDIDFLKNYPDIKIAKNKTIIADEFTNMTGMPGVFAGGDVFTGPLSIVASNRDGKNAARRIDEYIRTGGFNITDDDVAIKLMEKTGVYDKNEIVDYPDFPPLNFGAKEVVEPVIGRIDNFMEVDKGFKVEDAVYEATRCMRCYMLTFVKFED